MMCFSVHVDVQIKQLSKIFNAKASIIDERYKATALGPSKKDHLIIVKKQSEVFEIKKMIWSLTPKWSKDYACKWSTYNARMERHQNNHLERIYEVPTFKTAFKEKRFCLIPIQKAIEACYWGETAGKIIGFSDSSKESIYGLGLYEDWTSKTTGEVFETVTLLTDNPSPFYFEHGHDRSIIPFKPDSFNELVNLPPSKPETYFEFIRSHRHEPNWTYEVEREMKEGWQKKAPTSKELEEIKNTLWQP